MPDIESIEKRYLENLFPEIDFYTDNNNRCGGYKEGKISINLNCIKNVDDLYNYIFHKSIHNIQDKKSKKSIFNIIRKERGKISNKDLQIVFELTNPFEIMAYASTFAILLHLDM